jgi:hypothetical protein
MSLTQIIYSSQPFGYDESMLAGILLDARRCNSRDGVTGALLCRHDIYLQMLEGPESQVRATYERIERDDRHVNPVLLLSAPTPARLFGGWSMLHGTPGSWLWSEAEIRGGAIERATHDEIKGIFEKLAADQTDH